MTVVVVGDIVTDVLAVTAGPVATGSDTAASITIGGGGSAANTAAWLAHLGLPVTLVGAVGLDEAGTSRLAELAAAGVRCAVRRTADAATGAVVVLSGDGERSMLADRGANGHLRPADVLPLLPGAAHLHLSGYTLFDPATAEAGRAALDTARVEGATTSVDAASVAPLRLVGGATFLSWVRGADLLIANEPEARALLDGADGDAGELARRLTGWAIRVVVKRGADGSVWADRDGRLVPAPAQPATVVDVTGAGDAFAAGLLAAWLGGATPGGALAAGARLGAEAVGVAGGRPPARRR